MDMISNLGSVRWEDQTMLLSHMDVTVDEADPVVQVQRARVQELWRTVDALVAHNKQKDMREFMEFNGLKIERISKKKNKHELAYEVADALLHGKPGKCPVCDGEGTLRALFAATDTTPAAMCHGLVMGGSRCGFGPHGEAAAAARFGAGGAVQREVVGIPPALFARSGSFFKGMVLPASVLGLPGVAPVATRGYCTHGADCRLWQTLSRACRSQTRVRRVGAFRE